MKTHKKNKPSPARLKAHPNRYTAPLALLLLLSTITQPTLTDPTVIEKDLKDLTPEQLQLVKENFKEGQKIPKKFQVVYPSEDIPEDFVPKFDSKEEELESLEKSAMTTEPLPDVEITKKDLLYVIKESRNQHLMVLFYDKSDSKFEFIESQVRKAIKQLTTIREGFPEPMYIRLGTYEAPLLPKFEKMFKIYKFPKLVLFIDEKPYRFKGRRLTATSVIAWYKRIERTLDESVSHRLWSDKHLGNLLYREGTVVVFCSQLITPEFEIYDKTARDGRQIYTFSFDRKLCLKLHARHRGLENALEYAIEEEVPMTEEEAKAHHDTKLKSLQEQLEKGEIDDEEYFRNEGKYPKTKIVERIVRNETLFEELEVKKPVIFIAQKDVEEKSVVKMITEIDDVRKLRFRIKAAAEPAYFTDFDKFQEFNRDDNYATNWLILVYLPEDEQGRLVKGFKNFARANKFKFPKKFKVAVFNRDKLNMLKLELVLPIEGFHRLYYVEYTAYPGTAFKKYRALNVKSMKEVKKYYGFLRENQWDEYFFEEEIDLPEAAQASRKREKGEKDGKSDENLNYPEFEKLGRTSYFRSLKDRLGHLVVIMHRNNPQKVKKIYKSLQPILRILEAIGVSNVEFKHINTQRNDILDLSNPDNQRESSAPTWTIYKANSEETANAVNLDGKRAVLQFLESEIEDVGAAMDKVGKDVDQLIEEDKEARKKEGKGDGDEKNDEL